MILNCVVDLGSFDHEAVFDTLNTGSDSNIGDSIQNFRNSVALNNINLKGFSFTGATHQLHTYDMR